MGSFFFGGRYHLSPHVAQPDREELSGYKCIANSVHFLETPLDKPNNCNRDEYCNRDYDEIRRHGNKDKNCSHNESSVI